MKQILMASLFLLFFSVGCGSKVQFGLEGLQQNFTQGSTTANNEIDVLWVVDNSSSMSPLQANMTSNFSSFINNFQSKGYDFHMAVTTTDAYKANTSFVDYISDYASLALYQDGSAVGAPTNVFVITPTTPDLDNVFVTNATTGNQGSGDERAFSSMMTALDNPNNPNFLRSGSFLAVIILSDEDDFSLYSREEGSWGNNDALDHCYVDPTMDALATTSYSGPDHVATCANQTPPDSVNSYISALDQLTSSTGSSRRYNVSAITVLDGTCQQQHQGTDPNGDAYVTIVGQRYMQLGQATQGVLGSICDASYADSLSAIALQIATLSTQFFLNVAPNPTTIVVTVNGVTVPEDPNNGWTYSSVSNSVQFHGDAVPTQRASINVNFTPLTANH